MLSIISKQSLLSRQLFSSVIRTITTTTTLDLRSPGPRELTPTNIQRSSERFKWSCRARWIAPTLKEINRRKELVAIDSKLRYGEEKIPRRSDFTDWNYSSELFAFQARIGEKFEDSKLREAFITPDYLKSEEQRRKALGVEVPSSEDENSVWSSDNTRLSQIGIQILNHTLSSYVYLALPDLPNDGVESIVKYLMTTKNLSHISFHIGTKDLLLCEEYPPSAENMAQVFTAIVGALYESSGPARTIKFILDIVATQLHGVDLTDVWNLDNPMGYLARVLSAKGMGEPESRMLWCSGPDTILACYHIGIYSNKELIGQAQGETSEIGEEMAALDALRRIFNFTDSSKMLPFGKDVEILVKKIAEAKQPIKMVSQS